MHFVCYFSKIRSYVTNFHYSDIMELMINYVYFSYVICRTVIHTICPVFQMALFKILIINKFNVTFNCNFYIYIETN